MNPKTFLTRLNKLEPLDLSKRNTVSEIVEGLEKTAFMGRCLGKCTRTLHEWSDSNNRPFVVADHLSKPLSKLVLLACRRGWFRGLYTSLEYLALRNKKAGDRVLVLGNYNEATAERLHQSADELMFINQYYRCKPGQVRDGYFPHVVFADPNYIFPIMYATLCERKGLKTYYVRDLFSFLQNFPGLSAEVQKGAYTLLRMSTDKRCDRRFFTVSGAMTIAKMQLVMCDIIGELEFDYIAATGALMAHGYIEGIGDDHYEYDPKHDDDLLGRHGMNRVTDAIEPESNFDHLDEIMNEVLKKFDGKRPYGPSEVHDAMGAYHKEHFPDRRGILRLAHERGIPVLVPAYHDSEIGNDTLVHNLFRAREGRPRIIIDQEVDTLKLVNLMQDADRPGIFSVGGGTPRNTTQNVGPLREIATARGAANWPRRKFFYGCKIDPAQLIYGNLGSATYFEMISWRKAAANGIFAEIHTCATVTMPFIAKFALEMKN